MPNNGNGNNHNLGGVVKSIRDIMRKDAGEEEREAENEEYKSPLPEKIRWRNWAVNPEGMTGDELLDFINNDLFKTLKSLKLDEKSDQRGYIIKQVFEDAYNYMKNGILVRQVVNKINELDFTTAEDRHLFNDIYETILKELQNAGSAGEFYTPRPVTQFVVDMVNPKLGEKILDPACGTGGFLVDTLEYIRNEEVKTTADEKKLQNQIHGVELKPLPHLLAITNMILHGVDTPKTLRRGDMLAQPLREYGPKDRVDVIVANPPFGGAVKDGVEKNFPAEFRTRETADLFLVLFIHLLKLHPVRDSKLSNGAGGRAGIVLPDGSLFGEGVKTAIKKKLLEECNVHTIVRLPQGVFNPYAGVNTNLIFFTKGEPTKEIWYYQLPLPEGVKQYTKNRGITHDEFDPVRKWWSNRKANDNAWKVSIKQIQERNYNLDFKNPNSQSATIHKSPAELVREITEKESEISKILAEIKTSL